MNATLTERKPKVQKPLTIVRREVEANGIVYYILSGEIIYAARIENGAPCGCTSDNGSACASYYYSPKGHKHCKHTDLAKRTEQERSTDLQQHLQDEKHSCIYCGRPMKYDGWCGGCQ